MKLSSMSSKVGLDFSANQLQSCLRYFSHFLYKILIKVREVRSIYCELDKYLRWLKVILFLYVLLYNNTYIISPLAPENTVDHKYTPKIFGGSIKVHSFAPSVVIRIFFLEPMACH